MWMEGAGRRSDWTDPDMPEGSEWKPVRMSSLLFRLLGASGVEWGEPDADGFYTPTVYLGPDGEMTQRMVNKEMSYAPNPPTPVDKHD